MATNFVVKSTDAPKAELPVIAELRAGQLFTYPGGDTWYMRSSDKKFVSLATGNSYPIEDHIGSRVTLLKVGEIVTLARTE